MNVNFGIDLKTIKSESRGGLTVAYSYDIPTALDRIDWVKEMIGYYLRQVEKDSLESERVTTVPFVRGIYEELLYAEDIMKMVDRKVERLEADLKDAKDQLKKLKLEEAKG